MGDQMLLLGGVVCLWLYPMNVAFSLAFMWLCHAVWLCDALWLPERILIVMPLAGAGVRDSTIIHWTRTRERGIRWHRRVSIPRERERRVSIHAFTFRSPARPKADSQAHLCLFLCLCCAMACAYRERSKRRFQAACDRAKLFQDDPQAFFREKKFRAGGAAAPRAAPSFPDV